MKVALCCIGRMENMYSQEYVEYYRNLGVDKIFVYDNNHDGDEHFEEVLQPYIDDGLVDIVDFRNKTVCQLEAYQDCYDKHGNEYDWIAFFDFDEYLTFKDEKISIKDYLSYEQFNEYDMIHINWMIYDDNDLVYYENKPLIERFKRPKMPLDFKKAYPFPQNCHIKSIVRGNRKVIWDDTPHTPRNYSLKCCNSNGKACDSCSPFVLPFVFDTAYLRHFTTKTIEEFYTNKVKRGFPDGNKNFFKKHKWSDDFFTINDKTDEKMKYIESLSKEINEMPLDIFVCTHKDFEPIVKNNVYKTINCKNIGGYTWNGLDDSFISEILTYFYVAETYELKKYVGFCHYRRYFDFMDDIPDMDEIFNEYDVITVTPRRSNFNMREEYKTFHSIDDLNIIENIIDRKFPMYAKAMKTFLYGNAMFQCNIFIMKKEDFLEYIDFIKAVLDEYVKIVGTDIMKRVEDNKDVYLKDFYPNNTVEYQSRIGAFLAERLTSVFIMSKFKKAVTYNMVITEDKYKQTITK